MMRSRLLTIVALVGLAAPVTAVAQSYLTPEQILQQNGDAFLVPSHKRGAQWQADLQTQQNLDRHPSIVHQPGDPVVDDGLPPPVAIDESLPQPATGVTQNPYGSLDPLTARLLARMEQQNMLLQSQLFGTGAPLAQTGPAAILSVMAMAGAIILTLRRARVLSKFVA
jgi:hypothetical protein